MPLYLFIQLHFNLSRRWLAIIIRKKNLSSVGLIAIGTVRSQYASVSPARIRVPIPIERRWASGVVGSVKSFGNIIEPKLLKETENNIRR